MDNPKPKPVLCVLGAGYVGLTTAAVFACEGCVVYLVEPNPDRLKIIRSGRSFFYEEGLDALVNHALKSGKLIPTDSYRESVPSATVIFSCVGTPDRIDGSSNLDYVFQAATETSSLMQNGSIFVQKSTVPVGTGRKIEDIFKKYDKQLSYVSNPEFLREGTAVLDTLFFDRIVAGGNDKTAVEIVINLYRDISKKRKPISHLSGLAVPRLLPEKTYITTDLNSAELIKVTANAFLALKISFANSIAQLSDKVGADVTEVMNAVGADKRIGRAFLNAGRGYGGGCFPKDVSGLIASGEENGIDLNIMKAAQLVNDSMPGYILEKLRKTIGDLTGKRTTILGLAFKAGTSDTRRSPGVAMANTLARRGADVTVYDPKALKEAKLSKELSGSIREAVNIQQAIHGAEIVIVATDWPEFMDIHKEVIEQKVIVDAMNCLSRDAIESAGAVYVGVGR